MEVGGPDTASLSGSGAGCAAMADLGLQSIAGSRSGQIGDDANGEEQVSVALEAKHAVACSQSAGNNVDAIEQ